MDDGIFNKNDGDVNGEPSVVENEQEENTVQNENTAYEPTEQYTAPDNNSYQSDNNTGNSYGAYGNQYGYNQNNNPYGQNQYSQYGYNPQGQYGQYHYEAPNNSGKPPKKGNKGMKVFIGIVAAVVILCIVLIVALFAGTSADIDTTGDSSVVGQENSENKVDSSDVGDLVVSDSSLEAGEAAVVAEISQKYNVGILVYQDDALYTEGSGVTVLEDESSKYTYVVTCAHVVNHSNAALSVLMSDGTEYPADLVGYDTRTDIAVVRIEASGLPKAEFANSDELIVGQTVYAVGNPGGSEFFGSVSNGIISAIDRPISSSTGYEMECIQHTAAINPGNSGGALVNGEGKVIGINSMKIASTEYEGMGFAVPSSVVVEVFNSIIENGYVAGRAKLGITYTTPSGYSQTYAMYVQVKGLPSGTIVIAGIAEDSDLAGKDVQVGDMITQVNGKDMTDSGMLSDMIEEMSVGDTLTLTIVRVNTRDWSQTEQNVTVTLVEDRGTTVVTPDEGSNDNSNSNPYGSEYDDLYEYFKEYFGNNGGYGYGYGY
ncbi:MAG: trypsin-like peptidase domain-containing protein [Clostridia bacterium]|nr:trypsin-like peptidase domain-containing protein [Clostridia bacterium]